ncbi:MAG: hypothetical protein QME94_02920, partial [Anaerolineae bacterium]|nr:hypothetical protein [Anaerolineae bacterium]
DERLSSAMAELRAAAAMEVRTIVEHRVVDEDQWGRIHEPVWAVHRKLVEKREHHRSLLRTIVGKLEERRDTSQLIGALGDREVAIRDAAAGALGRLGDPSAVGPLIAALGAEGSGEAQDAMLDALQKLTGQDFEEAGLWSAWWQGQRGGGA